MMGLWAICIGGLLLLIWNAEVSHNKKLDHIADQHCQLVRHVPSDNEHIIIWKCDDGEYITK